MTPVCPCVLQWLGGCRETGGECLVAKKRNNDQQNRYYGPYPDSFALQLTNHF